MLWLKRLFGSGKPCAVSETSDREILDVSRGLTPEKIDRIMLAANSGDIRDQCRLAQELMEHNADIMQAMSTRKNAVIGCGWHLEPGDGSPDAGRAAELLEKQLQECGDGDDADTFEDLLEDLLGALLPGFAVSEILWIKGGGGTIGGFHHIEQKNFTFTDGFTPKLVTSDHPVGELIDRRRIIYHKLRIHGSDPVRGGLIRPLAWLHCFKNITEKDLLGFIERHGMPFIAAKVDEAAFEKEKNLVKRLVRSFGTSGGGIFTKNVELQLLESKNDGIVFNRLLEYLEKAVNKVILGQTASSGESAGLSKGDAQSKVRQDILESDCRMLQRTINSQLLKPMCSYLFGDRTAPPKLVIACAAPEDTLQLATVIKTIHDAGYETDLDEVGKRLNLKLTRRVESGSGKIESEIDQVSDDMKRLQELKLKYEAMGILIRAGNLTATPDVEALARKELGLPEMTPEVKKTWEATGGIRQPITLKVNETAAVDDALNVDEKALQAKTLPMSAEDKKKDDTEQIAAEMINGGVFERWFGPASEALGDFLQCESEENAGERLKKLAEKNPFGDSRQWEETLYAGSASIIRGEDHDDL